MKIRNKDLLHRYISKHTNAKNAVQRWVDIVERAEWKSHNDLKIDFPAVDYVGNGRYVFNIQGNNYRLVAIIIFIGSYMNIRFLGTHAEYDKIDCKTI